MHNNKLPEIISHLEKSLEKKIVYDEDSLTQDMQSERKQDMPLYIKILSIFGGLLGSLALLGFFLLVGLYDSEMGLVIFGTVCILVAVWINKIFQSLLLETGSISIYIIGYALLGFGLGELNVNDNFICILFIIIAIAAACISQRFILVFLSILIISGGLLSIGFINQVFNLIHLYIAFFSLVLTGYYLYEFRLISRFPKLINISSAIRAGLIFSLIMGLMVVGIRGVTPLSYQYVWISSVFTIACTVFVLTQVLAIFKIIRLQQRLIIYIATIAVLIPTSFSPAISGSILLILLNFKVNYKTGLIIGIIALLYFLSQFYYDLNFTLLFKSILLFISGVAFLVFYFLLHKYYRHEKV